MILQADRDILGDVVKAAPGRSELGGDSKEIVQVVPRRSGRIKRRRAAIGAIRIKVNKVSTALDNSLRMGQSCSTQLTAEKEKTNSWRGELSSMKSESLTRLCMRVKLT